MQNKQINIKPYYFNLKYSKLSRSCKVIIYYYFRYDHNYLNKRGNQFDDINTMLALEHLKWR